MILKLVESILELSNGHFLLSKELFERAIQLESQENDFQLRVIKYDKLFPFFHNKVTP